ncbi:MAG: amidohydrolase [Acidobacteriaceae bacterium]
MKALRFATMLAISTMLCAQAPQNQQGQTQPSPQNPQGQTPTPVSPEGGAPAVGQSTPATPASDQHKGTQPPQAASAPTGAALEAQREAARPKQQMDALKAHKVTTPVVVIRGGRVLTVTKGVIDNGAVVLRDGRITYVGPAAAAPKSAGAQVIDATGMTVYPGLIDMQTDLGLVEIEAEPMTVDKVEPSDEITPQMHVFDAFHAESARIPITRVNGVTNALVLPAETNTLPGQGSFIQLAGRDRDEMLMVEDIAMPLNFGPDQKRGGRGGPGGGQGGGYPTTRMGEIAQMRQAFLDAQEYDHQLKAGKATKRDLKLEALLQYLRGERPVIVGASEGSDVKTAMRLAGDFHLRVILNHVTHSQGILDQLAAYKVPVIVGPIYDFPKETERYDAVYRMPAELQRRGVKIAFASYDSQYTRNLPYAAGYAVAFGLPYDEALKAITINPAEMLGLGDQLGSLEVGKWGNVVVANGDPLDVKTDVKHVFIEGREVPLENRQTQLRDEYMKR